MDVIKVISYRVFFYWSRPKSVEDYKIPIQKMESEANFHFLASQDALEVMLVSEWVSQSVTLRTELTDVTLVSEDTYWGLYWQDSGN